MLLGDARGGGLGKLELLHHRSGEEADSGAAKEDKRNEDSENLQSSGCPVIVPFLLLRVDLIKQKKLINESLAGTLEEHAQT